MDQRTTLFQTHRKRLMGLAWRMLGSAADAEDVLQDAWLRWNESDTDSLRSAEAWLVTVVTRLSIDRLRAARAERAHYEGFWLPEPLVEVSPDSPQQLLERADDVSVAFLMVLERLAPEERAAFLLRQVFDADYAEVAQALGKSEAACRQLVHRAGERLREQRPRFAVSRETHVRLLKAFADAAGRGDLAQMRELLAEDAELLSDGGGKVKAFTQVLRGAQRLAQLYFAVARRYGPVMRMELVDVNGVPGLMRFMGEELESIQSFETDGQRIVSIHAQRNPDKLARAMAQFRRGLSQNG
ncbi:MAG: RNA polymerase sigma-70 factor [Ramlibacter sp.]|nr:RNA polymerase sigma-70 factor [Ramlibacter sp.]MBX3660024.1 RNA polymerase sigma-70 factor [Ramlibacter sp.]MCW5650905.1 RNA polymerase sigma-70 factor [Ramlibacter sp.]